MRDARLNDLISFDNYKFGQHSALNINGYAIKAASKEDFDEFVSDFGRLGKNENEKLAQFANKWFDIMKNRTVRYIAYSDINSVDYTI